MLGVRPPSAIDEHNSILSAPDSSAIRALSKLSTHTSMAIIVNKTFVKSFIIDQSKGFHRSFEKSLFTSPFERIPGALLLELVAVLLQCFLLPSFEDADRGIA